MISSAILCGNQWKGHKVKAFCNNTAAVVTIKGGVSKGKHMMHILKCVVFIEAYQQFQLTARYIPGFKNTMADDLS